MYITPGTSPGPDSLARIVKSAGGQVWPVFFPLCSLTFLRAVFFPIVRVVSDFLSVSLSDGAGY